MVCGDTCVSSVLGWLDSHGFLRRYEMDFGWLFSWGARDKIDALCFDVFDRV
jgi:hypothetical protein